MFEKQYKEQTGNLGRADLLESHLLLKKTEEALLHGEAPITAEELEEIQRVIRSYKHLLSNCFLHMERLKQDQFNGLIYTMLDLESDYRKVEEE